MKHDVWVIVLAPGDRDYSNFCFDTGVVATGWANINGYQNVIAKEDELIFRAGGSIWRGGLGGGEQS